MKNKKTSLFKIALHTLFLFGWLWIFPLYAQDFPATPKQLVTDYTNTLSAAEVNALEQKLLAFEDTTSTQIAVVLMNSTGDYDIADYGDRLAQQWAIGDAKYNNGILLLAAIGDRAVTIRTGYGIEGAVPDVIAYRIIENEIKPSFRNGNYFEGLDKATSALIAHTKGEYKANPKQQAKGKGGGVGSLVVIIIVIVVIVLVSKGGGNNKGGKVVGGRGSSDLFWWILMNAGGSGRDSGGGGFGGFGGGSSGGGFGGGGASGRW